MIESSSIISGVDLVGRVWMPNQDRAGMLPDPCDMSALAMSVV